MGKMTKEKNFLLYNIVIISDEHCHTDKRQKNRFVFEKLDFC